VGIIRPTKTTETADEAELKIVITLTSDKGQPLQKIRQIYVSREKMLSLEDCSLILYIMNRFERSV